MFIDNLEKLCSSRGISVSKLAEEVGRGSATATGWRKGAKPQADTLKKIADYFGITTDYLLSETEPSISASNIQNSAVVQGNHSSTIIVRNGERTERVLSEHEVELLRVYNALDVKRQTRLLTFAFELEGEVDYAIAARGKKGLREVGDKKEKEAIDRALAAADDLDV